MKKILLIFTLYFASFSYALEVQNSQQLCIGTTSGYAPYVSLDEKGAYEGFDIDVAELIAKKLHRKLVIKDCGSMPGLMLALKQKKVDALIWAISITEEREQNMSMVYYHGEVVNDFPVLFWKEIPEGITKIEDLGCDSKKTVCVEAGTCQEAILQKYPGLNVKYVDKITDAIMEIRYGKSLAATADTSLIPRFIAQHPEIKVVRFPLPSSQHLRGDGICINKENTKLTAEIKAAVEELSREGVIQSLAKKWNLAG